VNLLKAVGILKNAGLDVNVSESQKNGSPSTLFVNIDGIIMSRPDIIEMAEFHQRKAVVKGLRDFLAIVTWGAELQRDVEAEVAKFFEMQQMVWLHLEDVEDFEAYPESVIEGPMAKLLGEAINPIEDVTNSNGDPEAYYPFVGEEYQPSHNNAGVPEDVAAITELKQEAARVRVIEFKVGVLTYTRTVAKADAAAMSRVKADIVARLKASDMDVDASLRRIIPTLRVRPGYIYIYA